MFKWVDKLGEKEIKKLESLSDEDFIKSYSSNKHKGYGLSLFGLLVIGLCILGFIYTFNYL